MKIRSSRNKTLTLNDNERQLYSKELITLNKPCNIIEIENKIINQDFFDAIEYFPNEFADIIIIDPPYNINKRFGDIKFNKMSDAMYIEYIKSWLIPSLKCLKSTGSIYICCDWKTSPLIYEVLKDHVIIKNRITWQREKGRGSKTNWKNCIEDIWYGVKSSDFYFNVDAVKHKRKVMAPYKENGMPKDWQETELGKFRLTYPSNFWDDITVPYWSMAENTDHPTQKPEKLIAKLILASCPENGLVFDPFLGSGTTAVTALKLNRRYCGIERNTEYSLYAVKRLRNAITDNKIQGYSNGVFLSRNCNI